MCLIYGMDLHDERFSVSIELLIVLPICVRFLCPDPICLWMWVCIWEAILVKSFKANDGKVLPGYPYKMFTVYLPVHIPRVNYPNYLLGAFKDM